MKKKPKNFYQKIDFYEVDNLIFNKKNIIDLMLNNNFFRNSLLGDLF